MEAYELDITGSWLFTPSVHHDDRGTFCESFTARSFEAAVGHHFEVKQTNVSVSSRGTLRGIHFADVPPGQAKYVQCSSGSILDVVVDIRIGSPTFGQWHAVELDSDSRKALYIAEGLGHAFCALSESATVSYMCSEPYAPAREHGVHPFDPDIGIEWPSGLDLQLSPKDSAAPSFIQAIDTGLLPRLDECEVLYSQLREP